MVVGALVIIIFAFEKLISVSQEKIEDNKLPLEIDVFEATVTQSLRGLMTQVSHDNTKAF